MNLDQSSPDDVEDEVGFYDEDAITGILERFVPGCVAYQRMRF